MYDFDTEQEIKIIKGTSTKEVAYVFEVSERQATNIVRGKSDVPNTKALKAEDLLGWNPRALALIRVEYLREQKKKENKK